MNKRLFAYPKGRQSNSDSSALDQLVLLKEIYLQHRYPNVPLNFRPAPNTKTVRLTALPAVFWTSSSFRVAVLPVCNRRDSTDRALVAAKDSIRTERLEGEPLAFTPSSTAFTYKGRKRPNEQVQRQMQTYSQKAGGYYYV